MKKILLFGYHPVLAALKNSSRKIHSLIYSKELGQDILTVAKQRNLKLVKIDKNKLDKITNQSNHQGVALECETIFQNFDIKKLPLQNSSSLILILDRVTDVTNVGAIIRSACAFGVSAILIPSKNFPEENGMIAKLASGCLEKTPIMMVTNLNSAIDILKKHDYWIAGMDARTSLTLSNYSPTNRTALVMGSEGEGIRPLVKKNCDILLKIPMTENSESINVSNAAAIALHHIYSKR